MARRVWKLIAHHEDPAKAGALIKERGRIAVGWGATGSLQTIGWSIASIRDAAVQAYPDIRNWQNGARSLRHLREMQRGDAVIVSLSAQGGISFVVEVTGPYVYRPDDDALDGEYFHQRDVRVTGEDAQALWERSGGITAGELQRGALVSCGQVALRPLVLAQNEVTEGHRYDHWQDVTGEWYQVRNQYKNLLIPGRRFVYYRESRRRGGGRAEPEYFGHGVLGALEPDPENERAAKKTEWKWVAEIDDYCQFDQPVPFKIDGEHFEQIPQNRWGVAVREIDQATFDRILQVAGAHGGPVVEPGPSLVLPDLGDVDPSTVDAGLLVPQRDRGEGNSVGLSGRSPARRSPFSHEIGRRGEQIVLNLLSDSLPPEQARTLKWTAAEGETPGWDIEYEVGKVVVGVEVKATSGSRIPSLELTANEWRAAERLGPQYRIAVVVDTTTTRPQVQWIEDPAGRVTDGSCTVTPQVLLLRVVDTEG